LKEELNIDQYPAIFMEKCQIKQSLSKSSAKEGMREALLALNFGMEF